MPNSRDIEKNILISRLSDIYGALLTDRQRDVIAMYYDDDLSLGETAQLCGMTRQGVRDALLKSEAALLGYEKKLRLYARSEALSRTLARYASDLRSEANGNEAINVIAGMIEDITF